jgi:thiamine-phosphate pyrophosphorylase
VPRDGQWRRARLAQARLYLCVGRRADEGDLESFLDRVLAAGIDIVQLRDKDASADAIREAGEVYRAAALRHSALFILNDDPPLAARLDADGVHVGQDDPTPKEARQVVGPQRLVGRSTHTTDEQVRALTEDCDTFTVGPVHATPTKEGRPGIGVEPVRHAAALGTDKPWFVSGGMTVGTVPEVLTAGARRVVVVRAITEAPDPGAAAGALAALVATRW